MTATGTFGTPTIEQRGGLVAGAYGVAGLRSVVGAGTLAVELAGGVRSRFYSFESTHHHCETTSSITVTRGVVEARARGELWAGPWV